MASPRWALLALALLLLTGCATSTRIARMGPLPSLEPLVTLVVSDDRRVVERECRDVAALGFPDPHRSEARRKPGAPLEDASTVLDRRCPARRFEEQIDRREIATAVAV
jgi:hypothetical protein